MATLMKVVKLSKFMNQTNSGIIYTAVRNHWNKDFMPGPYPKTAEERIKAAKRYGVDPEVYEPYPDDGEGHGDYPKLPMVSGDARDPYYPYDFPELKRNFNEPVHVHQEMIGEDRYDVSARLRWPAWQQFLIFMATMTGFFSIYYWLERMHMFRPVIPKQYPQEGKTHYRFD